MTVNRLRIKMTKAEIIITGNSTENAITHRIVDNRTMSGGVEFC